MSDPGRELFLEAERGRMDVLAGMQSFICQQADGDAFHAATVRNMQVAFACWQMANAAILFNPRVMPAMRVED